MIQREFWFAVYKDGDRLYPSAIPPSITDFAAAVRYARRTSGNFQLVGVVSRELYALLF